MRICMFGMLVAMLVPVPSLRSQEKPKQISSGVQEYAQWDGFKVDSTSTYSSVSVEKGQTSKTEQVYTLKKVEAGKISLELQSTRTAADGKVTKSTGTFLLSGNQVSPVENPKIEEGDEVIEVGRKKLACHWMETKAEKKEPGGQTVSMVYRVSLCKDVPGGVVKSSRVMKAGNDVISSGEVSLVSYQVK